MKEVGNWYTNDSPEIIATCLNCKFSDCDYGKCRALASTPRSRRGERYEQFKALVDKGKPDNLIAIKLGVKIPTVRRYHQKLIAELEAGR